MKWIHKKDSYSGNTLECIVPIDDNHVLKCELYYREYTPAGRQYWSISYKERKELGYEIVLHVSKMRKEVNFLVGGIGKFIALDEPRVHRKTLKPLQVASENVTLEQVMAIGAPQDTLASRVV